MIKKLIGFILSAAIAFSVTAAFAEDRAEIYINKNSTGYHEEKGLFMDDVKNTDATGKTTRYSYTNGAVLSFEPNIKKSANYIVYYWSTGNVTNRTQQEFTINSDNGEAKVTLNLRTSKGWKYLGVYKFTSGGNAKISMTRDKFGGPVRSGMLWLVETDKPTAVAFSEEKPTVKREYLPGNGIFINNSFKSEDYTYEEADGGFGNVATGGADGRSVRYSYSADAKMRYRPNIPQEGKYHVLYYIVQNGNVTNTALKTAIYHKNGEIKMNLDCTAQYGWIYLGEYEFKQGTEGCLETQNGAEGKMLISGGAYFVSADDPDFDASLYATPSKPGSNAGVAIGDNGECVVTSDTVGYCEVGRKDQFKADGFNLDCNGRYSRAVGNSADSAGSAMKYTADIKDGGDYEILYFVAKSDDNAKAQRITVSDQTGTKEVTIDCTQNDGWVSLGAYKYDNNQKAQVMAYSSGSDGITRSGGVKVIKK